MEKKNPASATIELGKKPLKKVNKGLLEKWTMKRINLLLAYGKHVKILRWNSATNENNRLDWYEQGNEKFISSGG